MGIFSNNIIKRTHLYHYDNGDLEFQRRDLFIQSRVEFDNHKTAIRGWQDLYQNSYSFPGYKKIGADAVQPAYGRHFHLEVHDVLSDDLRPPADNSLDSPYIAAIAEARATQIMKNKKPHTLWEKMTLILGGAWFCELIIWGIMIATNK